MWEIPYGDGAFLPGLALLGGLVFAVSFVVLWVSWQYIRIILEFIWDLIKPQKKLK